MKIQLSNKRIIPNAMTVWFEPGPEVDVVMDLKNLTFAPGSIEKLYAFHVIEHFFPSEIVPALANWRGLLHKGSKMFVVNDDFEFVCRSFLGGDLSIDQFNDGFSKPSHLTRDNMLKYLESVGLSSDKVVVWFADIPDEFRKAEHELVIAVTV